jgi:N-hydroxyarylamine O-acetyltransferase
MNANAYLSRLAYAGPTTPDAYTLAALHLAHLRAVPFGQRQLELPTGAARPVSIAGAILWGVLQRKMLH